MLQSVRLIKLSRIERHDHTLGSDNAACRTVPYSRTLRGTVADYRALPPVKRQKKKNSIGDSTPDEQDFHPLFR
jgi:hypothetical protein